MNKTIILLMIAGSAILSSNSFAADVQPASNGIELPGNYKDWRMISQSHRIDNNTLRIILANDMVINAARKGRTNP